MAQPATQTDSRFSRGLAPYAVSEANSRGRRHQESAPRYRSEFQRDRDRIIHCAAFRRLEYKTQVFVNHVGDHFRTRLTHSLEVSQIARSIARELHLNEDLTEGIALAHDLGHTPFGHAGQDALNECMKAYGGFEHNLQSLRVVDKLEGKYAEFRGLNLTFETREGILKHCSTRNARALGELGRRFIEKLQPNLEAQLTDLSDEIAYNNHDVEDGLRAGLVTVDRLRETRLFHDSYAIVERLYSNLSTRQTIHEVIRRMINRLVVDLIETSAAHIARAGPANIEDVRRQPEALIGFSDDIRDANRELKRFLREGVYRHYRVHRMSAKARRTIKDLFAALMDDPALLPSEHRDAVHAAAASKGEVGHARVIADYIAGMTDRYAIGEHQRLFSPHQAT
ncbi:MAG: deoxyguanosinetriphosphate triphosphohydrolase [Gammaproteobacteria bacterium]